MVPISEMPGIKDNRIAAEAAQRMLGGSGQAFIAAAILISTFGCVNGLILAGARVVYAMARDRLFFPSMATVHARFRTPARALALQGVVAAALTLTVIGLFVLRSREPDLPRPYRAFGYPVVPGLYMLSALAIAVILLFAKPNYSFAGLVIVLLGIPVYYLWRASQKRSSS